MLRFVIGDEPFLRGLRTFLSDPARRGGNADTADFRRVMERASGSDLSAFFRAWVDGEGFFDLVFDVVEQGTRIAVPVRSISGGATRHRLPVVVRLVTDAGPVDRRVDVGPGGAVVRFRKPVGAWRVVFDPEGWLLLGDADRRPGLLRQIRR
jgi:aminopeptidase N